MSTPLDLRVLEMRLTFGDSLDAAECGALLGALREAKAALQPFVDAYGLDGKEVLVVGEEDVRRASAVLASLQ